MGHVNNKKQCLHEYALLVEDTEMQRWAAEGSAAV